MNLWLRIFLPFAAGYYFSYFLRNVNAVIAPELTRELGVSAADLGLLTSAYLLAFGAVQLPLGLALDRYGARRVEAFETGSVINSVSVWSRNQQRILEKHSREISVLLPPKNSSGFLRRR